MSIQGLMVHSLVVDHLTISGHDATGQPTESAVSTATPGRVEESGGTWPAGPGADPLIADARIYMPIGTLVTELDIVHRIDIAPVQAYQVLAINDAAGQGHHLEALARRTPL